MESKVFKPKQIKVKQKEFLTYTPDFTAKVFDIGVKGLSNQQLNRILKTSYSGLEIRKGIIA